MALRAARRSAVRRLQLRRGVALGTEVLPVARAKDRDRARGDGGRV